MKATLTWCLTLTLLSTLSLKSHNATAQSIGQIENSGSISQPKWEEQDQEPVPPASAVRPSNLRTQMAPRSSWGEFIGTTYRPDQAFTSPSNQIARFPNGSLSVIWRKALQKYRTGSMVGYNTKTNGQWRFQSDADSMRTLYRQSWAGPVLYPVRMPWVPQTATMRDGGSSFIGSSSSSVFMGDNIERGDWRMPAIAYTDQGHELMTFFSFFRTSSNPTVTPTSSVKSVRTMGIFSRQGNGDPATSTYAGSGFLGVESINYDMIDSRVAVGNGIVYTLGYFVSGSVDSSSYRASGLSTPLQLLSSTNNGVSWSRISIPGMQRTQGVVNVQNFSHTIAARGNTVAFFITRMVNVTSPAVELVLYKSTDKGLNWTQKVVSKVSLSDAVNLGGSRTGTYGVHIHDGSLSTNIDYNGVVHLAMGNGFLYADTNLVGSTVWLNGLLNPNYGAIRYWNESMGSAQPVHAALVERRGRDIPFTSANLGPGTMTHAAVSFPNLLIDRFNNIYIIYTGVVGGTEGSAVGGISRDIFGVASVNGGASFTPSVNLAAVVAGVEESPGGGADNQEDVYPNAVRNIGVDDSIHMTWLSSNVRGRNLLPLRGCVVNAISFPASKISGRYIGATFPLDVAVGRSFKVPYKLFGNLVTYGANNQFVIQVDTSKAGNFKDMRKVFTFGSITSRVSDTVTGNVPANFTEGQYHMRLKATAVSGGTDTVVGRFSNVARVQISAANPNLVLNSPYVNGQPFQAGVPIKLCGAQDVSLKLVPLSGGGHTNIDWTIIPANAGTVSKLSDTIAVLNMSPVFTGTISVSAFGFNAFGAGPVSPLTEIQVAANPYTLAIVGTGTNARVSLTSGTIPAGQAFLYHITYLNQTTEEMAKLVVSSRNLNQTILSLIPPSNNPNNVSVRLKIGDCFSNEVFMPYMVTSLRKPDLASQKLIIYPNPAKDKFVVGLTGDNGAVTAQVLNAMGQLVTSKVLAQETEGAAAEFSTSAMPAGIYTVRVVTTAGIKTSRLVID